MNVKVARHTHQDCNLQFFTLQITKTDSRQSLCIYIYFLCSISWMFRNSEVLYRQDLWIVLQQCIVPRIRKRPSLLRSAWKETRQSTYSDSVVFSKKCLIQNQLKLPKDTRGFLLFCTGFVSSLNHRFAFCKWNEEAMWNASTAAEPSSCQRHSEMWVADVNRHVGATGVPSHWKRWH